MKIRDVGLVCLYNNIGEYFVVTSWIMHLKVLPEFHHSLNLIYHPVSDQELKVRVVCVFNQ